ncbi:helix-turn-helix domain-containing protein [Spiractinospora alimapuensis]|nr:helix-turn-helix domain-containing protein [Spiractinospora alimapuensis]
MNTAQHPMPVTAIARKLGLHRSIVYRMLRTLEDHRLVTRTADGCFELGLGLAVLSRGVRRDLQTVSVPVLSALANEVRMTAFLTVASDDEAVTLVSVEPHQSVGHIAYAPGNRHSLHVGAPGIATLSALPPHPDERPEVTEARRRGWAHSYAEVLPGMSAIAAPVAAGQSVGAIAVVFVDSGEPWIPPRARLGERLVAAAREVTADMV